MRNGTFRIGLTLVIGLALLSMSTLRAGDDQVMVTHPGVVFHLAGAHDFHGRGVGKSMEAAMAAGYAPCPVCFGKAASTGGSVAKPAGGATAAAASAVTALAKALGPTAHPKDEYRESRGGSRVMATGCLSHDAICPYGAPFHSIPGL